MKEIEQTLDSREVAEMVEKEHSKLLKDIRRYVDQLGKAKIGHSDLTKSRLMWLKKCLTFGTHKL
jgi:Uncharacterized phage-encoded protein